MAVLKIILTVVFIIISIALTVIILMQESKSAGLGAIAGAADTYLQEQRTFHGRKTGNRNQNSGCLVYCDCCCIESGNFLRNAKDCREYDSLFFVILLSEY